MSGRDAGHRFGGDTVLAVRPFAFGRPSEAEPPSGNDRKIGGRPASPNPTSIHISKMLKFLRALVLQGLEKQVSATGLGVFRILAGLVILQEVFYLMYFRHLIFDRVPYTDMASPVVDLFLAAWALIAAGIVLGWHTRLAAAANYVMWLVFVGFTPMWLDFDGGFDQMMTGVSFLLLFLPSHRALSLDNLRDKLQLSAPGKRYQPATQVSVLCYYLPLATVMGFLYLDAGIHKLSAEFWRNGMGSWLPPTMPYYMSPIDMSWLLNNRLAEQVIGYSLIVFQFLFLPLFWFRRFRVPLLLMGVAFHVGIILSLNIYQFGFGMLAPYALLVPFSWWRTLGNSFRCKTPTLTVFYDEQCPLCNRTVITLSHFDVRGAVAFKGLQTYAAEYPSLAGIPERELLTDLYALDPGNRLHRGFDTYIRIFEAMTYLAPVGWLMRTPGIYHLGRAIYRRIADNRLRVSCDASCAPTPLTNENDLLALYWQQKLGTPRQQANRLAKMLVLAIVLQLNSTLQFGVFYRLNGGHATSATGQLLEGASNAVLFLSHTLLGITPHALYMHDHFVGYNHILAITWKDAQGAEQWLPIVNPDGRIIAPNWGRVQCWWANIVVTPHIKLHRLEKGLMQVIAFWGTQVGVDFRRTVFSLKMKEIEVPMDWQPDLRVRNLARPWREIGTVIWKNGQVVLDTPGLNLEVLGNP